MCETPNSLLNLRVLQVGGAVGGQALLRPSQNPRPHFGRACGRFFTTVARMQPGEPFALKAALPTRDEIRAAGDSALTSFQLNPSSSNSSILARLTCAAGSLRDRAQPSNSPRSAALNSNPLPMGRIIHYPTIEINVTRH